MGSCGAPPGLPPARGLSLARRHERDEMLREFLRSQLPVQVLDVQDLVFPVSNLNQEIVCQPLEHDEIVLIRVEQLGLSEVGVLVEYS